MVMRLLCGILVVSLVCGCCCHKGSNSEPEKDASAQAAPPTQPAYTRQWTSLFDGKTLGQWTVTDFGGQGNVRVKDSNLLLPAGGPLTGVTWGGEVPKINYEIALEAQRVDGSDFFCALTFPIKDSHASLVLGGWGGSVCGISSLDHYDASENETTTSRQFETGKWYHVRVRVTDAKLQAWFDDEKIVDIELGEKKVGVRFEMEPCRPLGLATYATSGAMRDIRLRLLGPEELQ